MSDAPAGKPAAKRPPVVWSIECDGLTAFIADMFDFSSADGYGPLAACDCGPSIILIDRAGGRIICDGGITSMSEARARALEMIADLKSGRLR